MAVGASGHSINGIIGGAAYVFKQGAGGNWVLENQLLPESPADGIKFGSAVSVRTAGIVVGVQSDEEDVSRGGAITLFEQSRFFSGAGSLDQAVCTAQGHCICQRGWGGADCSIQLPDNPAPPAPVAGAGGGCSIQPYVVDGEPVLGTFVAECPGQDPMLLRGPACGDGVKDAGETCDDGNLVTEACAYGEQACIVCDGSCAEVAGLTSFCGDGALNELEGEECDDGGNDNEDDCSNSCTLNALWQRPSRSWRIV